MSDDGILEMTPINGVPLKEWLGLALTRFALGGVTVGQVIDSWMRFPPTAPPAAVPDSVRRDAEALSRLGDLSEGTRSAPVTIHQWEAARRLARHVLAHPAPAVGMEVVGALRGIAEEAEDMLDLGDSATLKGWKESIGEIQDRARAALASLPSQPDQEHAQCPSCGDPGVRNAQDAYDTLEVAFPPPPSAPQGKEGAHD